MSISSDADRALGIELQIEELVEQRQRAAVQGRQEAVTAFDERISALYDELAEVADHLDA